MGANDKVVKRGKYYHEFTVPARIFVIARGSENSPLYFVQFEGAGAPGVIDKEEGPFYNIQDAQRHAQKQTNGTLRWS